MAMHLYTFSPKPKYRTVQRFACGFAHGKTYMIDEWEFQGPALDPYFLCMSFNFAYLM